MWEKREVKKEGERQREVEREKENGRGTPKNRTKKNKQIYAVELERVYRLRHVKFIMCQAEICFH